MTYIIGTATELHTVESVLPPDVFTDLCNEIAFLDSEYGKDRNYRELGGYVIAIETEEDLTALKNIVNYESHPCEWAVEIGKALAYITATYILSNDFAVTLYLPRTVAPNTILSELED